MTGRLAHVASPGPRSNGRRNGGGGLTSYAGLEFVRRWLQRDGLLALLRRELATALPATDYGAVRLVPVVLALLLSGGRRVRHLHYLVGDPLVLRFCALRRLPRARTVGGWLGAFRARRLPRLQWVHDARDSPGRAPAADHRCRRGRRPACRSRGRSVATIPITARRRATTRSRPTRRRAGRCGGPEPAGQGRRGLRSEPEPPAPHHRPAPGGLAQTLGAFRRRDDSPLRALCLPRAGILTHLTAVRSSTSGPLRASLTGSR